MLSITDLPTLNALLNATATVCCLGGYLMIRKGKSLAHKRLMIAALSASLAFLASYLFYHFHAGSKPFQGQGWIRPVYFGILLSHTVLAAIIVPLIIVTVSRAWRGHFGRHRRVARITLPLWLYVSFTGVVIYLMLYS